jgi:serine/threonine protein kinase
MENLIPGQDGALRITDFGLSQITSQCNRGKGSQAYLCPEMNHDEFPCDGKKADAWSAGVVVFTVLVGHSLSIRRIVAMFGLALCLTMVSTSSG